MPVRDFNKVQKDEPGSHRFIYRANRIVNSFTNGQFTQQISATQMFDTFSETTDMRNEQDQVFPLLGDQIIFPGTDNSDDNARNANTLVSQNGPFSFSGIDIIPDDLGLDDD